MTDPREQGLRALKEEKAQEAGTRVVDTPHLRYPADNPTAAGNEEPRAFLIRYARGLRRGIESRARLNGNHSLKRRNRDADKLATAIEAMLSGGKPVDNLHVVAGSTRFYCRSEGCGCYSDGNVPYGYCDRHLAQSICGSPITDKLGFPPVGGWNQQQAVDAVVAVDRVTSERPRATPSDALSPSSLVVPQPPEGEAVVSSSREWQEKK
jgi:hypothetical protein